MARRAPVLPFLVAFAWAGLVFLLVSNAAAQERSSWTTIRATELLGRDVVNPQNEGLGEIVEVILDQRAGEVQYAVLESGDRLFPYPLTAFRRTVEGNRLVLRVQQEALASAGGGLEGSTEVAREPYLRATGLLGRPVVHSDGSEAGEVDDIVFDLASGEALYAQLEYDTAAGPGSAPLGVPLEGLRVPERGPAVLRSEVPPRETTGFQFRPSDERRRLHSPFTP